MKIKEFPNDSSELALKQFLHANCTMDYKTLAAFEIELQAVDLIPDIRRQKIEWVITGATTISHDDEQITEDFPHAAFTNWNELVAYLLQVQLSITLSAYETPKFECRNGKMVISHNGYLMRYSVVSTLCLEEYGGHEN